MEAGRNYSNNLYAEFVCKKQLDISDSSHELRALILTLHPDGNGFMNVYRTQELFEQGHAPVPLAIGKRIQLFVGEGTISQKKGLSKEAQNRCFPL